jgi:tyrosine-protein phosphatase YwqE
MRVDVYFNLHKKLFSVRSRERSDYGKVIMHVKHLWLKNCQFVVRERGRERVLREKKKNVHAFVRGELEQPFPPIIYSLDEPKEVTYNPYRWDTFVEKETQVPIKYAEIVEFFGKKVKAYMPKGV